MMITIPEGVSFYSGDPTHRAAVNLLVERADVPADLDLGAVEQFETAALAAQRVRLDFWRLLRQLWSAVWPEAVVSAFPLASLQTYGEHQAFTIDELVPSVARAWEGNVTFGIFTLPHGRLVTRLRFRDAAWRQPELGFYLIDAAGAGRPVRSSTWLDGGARLGGGAGRRARLNGVGLRHLFDFSTEAQSSGLQPGIRLTALLAAALRTP